MSTNHPSVSGARHNPFDFIIIDWLWWPRWKVEMEGGHFHMVGGGCGTSVCQRQRTLPLNLSVQTFTIKVKSALSQTLYTSVDTAALSRLSACVFIVIFHDIALFLVHYLSHFLPSFLALFWPFAVERRRLAWWLLHLVLNEKILREAGKLYWIVLFPCHTVILLTCCP